MALKSKGSSPLTRPILKMSLKITLFFNTEIIWFYSFLLILYFIFIFYFFKNYYYSLFFMRKKKKHTFKIIFDKFIKDYYNKLLYIINFLIILVFLLCLNFSYYFNYSCIKVFYFFQVVEFT